MRHLVLFALITVVAGCGLHLRGSSSAAGQLSGHRINLESAQAPAATAELRDILAVSDVDLERESKDADYTIRLAGERITREVLSVSPQTGKVEEFQLTYVVLLTVTRAGGDKPLLEQVPVSLQRDFTFDQDAVLGNFSEEEVLRNEMSREAAEQVLRRSAAAINRDAQTSAR